MLKRIVNKITDPVSSKILDNPYMFNYVRYLLAGKQKGMKKFIQTYLNQYECKTIADICSGTGDFAALTPFDAQYTGWDLNQDFIDFAAKRYRKDKNKKFVKANVVTSNKLKNKKYDAVLLISAVHHFSDEDLKVLLPLVKSITKKVVIIADIIPDPPHLLQRFFVSIDRGKFVRPAEEKVRILNQYFKVVRKQPIPTRSAVQLGIVCEIKQ